MRSPLPPQRPPTKVHRLEDCLPPTNTAHLRIGIAKLQAKANRVDRSIAALWQQEQDRRAREEGAAAERRRKGR